jgi:ankyrin repeat protein
VRKSTPLHNAASGSHARLTRFLLENGAKVDSKDEDGKTPLDWCPSDTDHVKEILRGYRETKEK